MMVDFRLSAVRFAGVPLLGASLLLVPLTGCIHKKVKPAVIAHTPPPPLSQSPLYTSEMGDKAPPLPPIPAPDGTSQAQPAPPAQPDPKKYTAPKHPKPSPAKPVGEGESTTAAKEAPKEAGAASAAPGAQTATAGGADGPSGTAPAPPTTVAKKATEDEAVASPIGQLTAGSTQDAGQSRHEASELIRTTQNGVTGIKRTLTADQNKIVLQIHSFLQQAQKALDNGDTDGAYTLATKARVLLDELLAPSP
jgi:hypothetical protein